MYKFIQPTDTTIPLKTLPSVAMNFNGKYIENELNGYRTLKVSGRETIGVEHVTENTHEGLITIDSRLPHRELVITYELTADDGKEFQDRYRKLRRLLTSKTSVLVRFLDEPNTIYFGRLAGMDTPPDDSNTVVSTFVVLCDSPYKFGELITTNGAVAIDTFYPAPPEIIELTIRSTVNRIKINNGNKEISATGTFNASSKVVIEFKKEEVTMAVNGVESTYMIDLQSDLENFLLVNGQQVSSPQGNIELRMRERWL